MAIFAKTVPNTHTAAPADYFGPPAGATYAITTLFFCNTTTSDVIIDVWILDTSSVTIGSTAPPDQYKYLHQLIIPPGDTFTGDTGAKLILDENSMVYWLSDTPSAVNAIISYMEL
tara:strand:- start:4404 stop:4751 length:348 start_codon:yes stop_codon:yes gene_type:complete